jgi:hypothetical protein
MSYRAILVKNAREMKDFLRLPFLVYRHDQNWVPPLTSEVRRVLDERCNPYFAAARLRLFLVYKDNSPVARASLVISRPHQEKFGVKAAFFGFFEAVRDPDAVRTLLAQIENHCRSEGVELLEGPLSPNHYSELAFQASHFGARPSFFQPYNPRYYNDWLEEAGFHVSARFHSRKNENIRGFILKKFGVPGPVEEANGFQIRSFSLDDYEGDLERIREVNNDAFSSNWHFLPLSREEYVFSSKYLRLVTRPELIKIVENQGEPIGVVHCVLDINPLLARLNGKAGPLKYMRFLWERRRIRKLIIYSVAIKKAYQHGCVFELMFREFLRMALNFDVLETTWLSGENAEAVHASKRLGLIPDKEFAVYEKRLAGKSAEESLR